MKIIRLNSENVKRLRAVEIKPDGNTVVIGGRNGQGKSSVLDSISAALGGKKLCPKVPIRRGEDHAEVRVELDDLVVVRRWTEKDSYLSVENRDGAAYKSPQHILDSLVGRLTFDPLEFSRLDAADQLETVHELVGLDFSALDAARDEAYDKRRDVNRELKREQARLGGMEHHDDAPDTVIVLADLLAELQRREAINNANDEARRKCDQTRDHLASCREAHRDAEARVRDLEEQLAQAQLQVELAQDRVKRASETDAAAGEQAEGLEDADLDEVRAEISGAEEINRKVRANAEREMQGERVLDMEAEAKRLTDEIAAIDARKQKLAAEAKYPIEGLEVGDGGVMFNGLPLEQASAAESLRVSAAIGFAVNPKLRVLLIRDGSLLDEESLGALKQMAEEADAQVWLERVGDGGASVVIEDGAVAGAEEAAE